MKEIDKLVAGLSGEKRKLLSLLLGEEGIDIEEKTIRPVPRDGTPLPLSFPQQRVWVFHQFEPDSSGYNIPNAYRLQGHLNLAALEESLIQICQRHESLRTTFVVIDGEPKQVIGTNSDISLSVVDLRELSQDERDIRVEQLIDDEAHKPFDLKNGPLWRTQVLQLGDSDYILLVTMHHSISDGWSMGVFNRELSGFYNASLLGKAAQLADLSIQYADYAVWHNQQVDQGVFDKQLTFWKEQFRSLPDVLELPTDRTRPAIQTYRGANHTFSISETLTEAIRALSRAEGCTLFMTLLAAYNTLLARYSGQDDIAVGTPIAYRNRVEFEGLIGYFANTLVLRADLTDDPTFRQLMHQMRELSLQAYDHQDLPLERLALELDLERTTSYNPLFQVMFTLQNVPDQDLQMHELSIQSLPVIIEPAQYDLTLDIFEEGATLKCVFAYSVDLFDASTIERLAKHFEILLKSITQDPQLPISQLRLLSDAEQHQVLVEWNQSDIEYAPTTLHKLFEQAALQNDQATAVVDGERSLTFGELNRRANQLAHYLREHGVETETLVGISTERSIEVIIGILGVLKAGAAYVPLDPSYPQERLAWILEESQASVILTTNSLLKELPETNAKMISLEKDSRSMEQQADANLDLPVDSENLAYVLFTSGSTGKPKGVMVEHRNVVALLYGYNHLAPVSEAMVGTSVCPFGFDVSVWEIFSMLCFGGTLHILQTEKIAAANYFADYLIDNEITNVYLPPALLDDVISYLEAVPEKVRINRILVGVEPIKQRTLQRYRNLSDTMHIINGYGPTETTICGTFFDFKEEKEPEQRTPIGTAIPGYNVYLVDANLQPVPVGVVGEILIGGAGVGRGYLNQPEMTAERFISDPFNDNPAARVYKTGDLARYLPDGNIVFVGRNDNQVKIRGFRVELGEIDAALAQYPAIKDSVVIAREDVPGEKYIAAYLVAGEQQEPTEETQLAGWEDVFDNLHTENAGDEELAFFVKGWTDSYTGQQMPDDEIREWMNQTIDRILALNPTKVYDIGCGTGLMVFRVGPNCSKYVATDISENALAVVQKQLSMLDEELPVTLHKRAADDFADIKPNSFNAVLSMSVVQYFPNVEYLLRVIEGAVEAVEPGGFIFLADVRSLPLAEVYYTSVQLYRSADSLSLSALREAVYQAADDEKQLLVDPNFFIALKNHLSKISRVEILLERGKNRNELTKFRYDVIIHIGNETNPVQEVDWLDWDKNQLSVAEVRNILIEKEPDVLGITWVPNVRVWEDVKVHQLVFSEDAPSTVGDLREIIATSNETGIDPEDFWCLGDELPYSVDITWSESSDQERRSEGRYDVLLRRRTDVAQDTLHEAVVYFPDHSVQPKPWSEYTNVPSTLDSNQIDLGELRTYLRQKLPHYMVPSSLTLLTSLPQTANGKIDRRALPVPNQVRRDAAEAFVAAASDIEKQLVTMWLHLLPVERVGINDNFFDIGGHSLLAARLSIQIEEEFGTNLPLTTLYQQPTIAELAKTLSRQSGIQAWPTMVAIQPHGTLPPFFCTHPYCGDVVGYKIWADYLGKKQPFYGIRARGLDGVQEPFTDIDEMTAHYVEEIRLVQPTGPYYLGGYAAGSIFAFAVAQHLKREGDDVALLVVINGSPPPSRFSDYYKVAKNPKFLIDFSRNLPYWTNYFAREKLATVLYQVQLQGRKGRAFDKLQNRLSRIGILKKSVEKLEQRSREIMNEHDLALLDNDGKPRDLDKRQIMLDIAHTKAVNKYQMDVYDGRITILRTKRQPLFCSYDRELGWGNLARDGVDVRDVTGSTPGLLRNPHAQSVGRELKACLDAAHAANGVTKN